MSQPCYAYVISIVGQDLCKIGISQNPLGRLSQLLTGSPFEMHLVCAFRLWGRDDALAVERAFHWYLKDYRSRGEWFVISPDDAVEMMAVNIAAFFRRKKRLRGDALDAALISAGAPQSAIDRYHDIRRGAVQ